MQLHVLLLFLQTLVCLLEPSLYGQSQPACGGHIQGRLKEEAQDAANDTQAVVHARPALSKGAKDQSIADHTLLIVIVITRNSCSRCDSAAVL